MVRRFNANGEYVSKEQFCKICHLKKSKARQLLQSGLVPCIDTGIPTARYQIALKDVIKYLQDREIDPERFGYRRNITIFYKGIMPSEKILDLPVDCNTLTGSVNL